MTTPAHSPEPVTRSRKLYVLWAIALTLLLTAALFCWLVVVPFMKVRSEIAKAYDRNRLNRGADWRDLTSNESLDTMVKELGGKRKAIGSLSIYVRAPEGLAPEKWLAAKALGHCHPRAVPVLLRLLDSEDARVRTAATESLRAILPEAQQKERAVARLIELLGDQENEVRAAAIGALARAEYIPALCEAAMHHDHTVRVGATEALGAASRHSKRAVSLLCRMLKDPSPEVRETSAIALRRIGRHAEAALSTLREALRDKDEKVRLEAAHAVWRIAGDSSVRPILTALLTATDPDSRRHAAQRLGRMGPAARPALGALAKATMDPDEKVRFAAASALGELDADSKRIVPVLAKALGDKVPKVRRGAARALALYGAEARLAAPGVIGLLADKDIGVRVQAVMTLGSIGREMPATVSALSKALSDESSLVRYCAVTTLREMGTVAATACKDLKAALGKDIHKDVQIELAVALYRTAGDKSGLTVVVDALGARQPDIRRSAAAALGKFGRAAADHLPALMKCLTDEDSTVREYSVETLGRTGVVSEAMLKGVAGRLKDESCYVRAAAVITLGRIGPAARLVLPELRAHDRKKGSGYEHDAVFRRWAILKVEGNDRKALEILLDALKLPRRNGPREEVVRFLGELGPAASRAVPALARIRNDGTEGRFTRRDARESIRKITESAKQREGSQ